MGRTVVTDTALSNAKARLTELSAEMLNLQTKTSELRQEKARVEQFIADWNAFAGIISDPESSSSPKSSNPHRVVVGNIAEKTIKQAGRPIPRTDLFAALNAAGLHITGKDPEMVLSTMMWRMQDRFVRIPRFGYWMRDRPCAVANYKPGDIPDTRKTGGKADDFADANENDDMFE
jgi:hypothetical protein